MVSVKLEIDSNVVYCGFLCGNTPETPILFRVFYGKLMKTDDIKWKGCLQSLSCHPQGLGIPCSSWTDFFFRNFCTKATPRENCISAEVLTYCSYLEVFTNSFKVKTYSSQAVWMYFWIWHILHQQSPLRIARNQNCASRSNPHLQRLVHLTLILEVIILKVCILLR